MSRLSIQRDGKILNIIDSRWVFKMKIGKDREIRFNGKLGFKDKNVYEWRETYAPVSGLPMVRASLAIVNKYEWVHIQFVVETAFLYEDLVEGIYMELPEGVDVTEDFRETHA